MRERELIVNQRSYSRHCRYSSHSIQVLIGSSPELSVKVRHRKMREVAKAMPVISFFDVKSFVERVYLHLRLKNSLVEVLDQKKNKRWSDLLDEFLGVLHHTHLSNSHE
jgi:type II secretory pathway predicted ATPase ExeA